MESLSTFRRTKVQTGRIPNWHTGLLDVVNTQTHKKDKRKGKNLKIKGKCNILRRFLAADGNSGVIAPAVFRDIQNKNYLVTTEL